MLNNRSEPGWADMRNNRSNCNCDCNGVGQPNEGCCSGSHLRDPGIKRIRPGLYFADADLQCRGSNCSGADRDIIYEWTLYPLQGSNVRIVGDSRKVGNDRLEIAGTGTFELYVKVTFRCYANAFVDCVRETSREFTERYGYSNIYRVNK